MKDRRFADKFGPKPAPIYVAVALLDETSLPRRWVLVNEQDDNDRKEVAEDLLIGGTQWVEIPLTIKRNT
jgi:hypothetical protein